MASKTKERNQKIFTIALAVMVTVTLAGAGGLFGGTQSDTPAGDVSNMPLRDYGRVVCSTSDDFNIYAVISASIDEEIYPAPRGIGITEDCLLEINIIDDTGRINIKSEVDKKYTWNEFFNVGGISPFDTPGFILLNVVLNEESIPGQEFDFDSVINNEDNMILEYISIQVDMGIDS